MKRLEGRTALVTGASRGLGRALAVALAAEGAYVFAGYRSQRDEALVTLEQSRAAGGEGEAIEIDVRDRVSIDHAVAAIIAGRPALDVLVNNAGVARDALVPMMTPEDWQEVMAVNLTGAFHCCQAAARPMVAQRRGAIVNVASIAGLFASVGQANYAASKGGLIAFTRTLAAELAPYEIRVNAVVPGLLSTGMATRVDHHILERRLQSVPLRRAGTPEEVARVVTFLASDDSSYVTGQAIVADGGLSL